MGSGEAVALVGPVRVLGMAVAHQAQAGALTATESR